jgi:hypothetical protein
MKCAVPRTWEFHEQEIGSGIAVPRGVLIVLAAFLTTSLWAGIIGAVCWAAGIWMSAGWFVGILAVLFTIALLGLSLVAGSANRPEKNDADPA